MCKFKLETSSYSPKGFPLWLHQAPADTSHPALDRSGRWGHCWFILFPSFFWTQDLAMESTLAWNSQCYCLGLLHARTTGLHQRAWLHLHVYAFSAVSVVLALLSSSTQTKGHLITDGERNNKLKVLSREMGLQGCGATSNPNSGGRTRQQCLKPEPSLSHRARTRPVRARLSSKTLPQKNKTKIRGWV